MKTSLKSLFAVAAFSASALLIQAQPAPKVFVVDLAKAFEAHYKAEEQNTKLRADEQKAREEIERLNKEGNALVEQFKEMVEQTKNPALSADARTRAEGDAEKKREEIMTKQNEVQQLTANAQRALQQRAANFRGMLLEEISKLATDISKKKGATLLIDKSGPTGIGISNLVYSDPAYDITDDVIAEINKTRPAGTPAPAAAPAPAAPTAPAPAAPAQGAPKVTFPGAKK